MGHVLGLAPLCFLDHRKNVDGWETSEQAGTQPGAQSQTQGSPAHARAAWARGSRLAAILPARKHLAMSGDVSGCHSQEEGAVGGIEGAAQLPVCTGRPGTESHRAPHVTSAEVEKP